jgi:RNA polymerase sigma factor (sigma-70 family)
MSNKNEPYAKTPTSYEQVASKDLLELFKKVIQNFKPREQKVLDYRFGLTNNVPMTRASIGNILNLSRERIRQIEYIALRKIRNPKCLDLLGIKIEKTWHCPFPQSTKLYPKRKMII